MESVGKKTTAFVYILTTAANKFYIGSTLDLEKRMRDHAAGTTKTTKRLGNPRLVFYQEYPTISDARYIERRLKKLKKRVYIEKIIQERSK